VVRGRAWIAVLFVMLAGIVAMQVEVLKLNRTMGRAIEQATALQSRNELLRASVASLADDQRIERLAAAQGMVMPAPEDIGFLSASPANAGRAANRIRTPDSGVFQSLLTSNGGIASTAVPPVMSTASTAGPSTNGG
jgi:cell division protein FtsL